MPDSTQLGYLAPTPPGPLYDDALEDLFQQLVVGITGLAGARVRPRWQPGPGDQPSTETDWIALGLSIGQKQWNAYQHFDPTVLPSGAYIVEGSEELRMNLSFYGPNNEHNLRLFQDGILVEQNRDAIELQKIKYVGMETPVNLPALLKERWTLRVDARAVFSRWCIRTYPVVTLQSASVDLDNERYHTPITINPPSP